MTVVRVDTSDPATIERAAKALHDAETNKWEDAPAHIREDYLRCAAVVLASLPLEGKQ